MFAKILIVPLLLKHLRRPPGPQRQTSVGIVLSQSWMETFRLRRRFRLNTKERNSDYAAVCAAANLWRATRMAQICVIISPLPSDIVFINTCAARHSKQTCVLGANGPNRQSHRLRMALDFNPTILEYLELTRRVAVILRASRMEDFKLGDEI